MTRKKQNQCEISGPKTATKAIRLKCLDCSAGSITEVEKCQIKDCSLWTRRFGIRPQTALARGKDVAQN